MEVLKPSSALRSPLRSLLYVFCGWKALLLAIALGSPGPGYDTSTSLILPPVLTPEFGLSIAERLAEKLTRWDAIYYTTVASRDYLFEQEWAFGWGWTRLISFFCADLKGTALGDLVFLESLVGIALAHIAHGLSVIVLYHLAKSLFPGPSGEKVALISGYLHTVTPGGMFLSAPYGESPFSLLSFLGLLAFTESFPILSSSGIVEDFLLLASGAILACATTIRSNGILSGTLFLVEAVRIVLSLREGITVNKLRRLVFTGLGGLVLGTGFLYPQYVAYIQYCTGTAALDDRPWCSRTLPGIYTFVQNHYWDVGFLRYWKIPNLPLFALAIPMLVLLISSSVWTFGLRSREYTRPSYKVNHFKTTDSEVAVAQRSIRLLKSLAVPQLLLALLAITNYHVQIINRIASGYPVWYLWIASALVEETRSQAVSSKTTVNILSQLSKPIVIVQAMVIYGLIQGGLFASFLPPA